MKVYKSMNDRYRLAEIDKETFDRLVRIEKENRNKEIIPLVIGGMAGGRILYTVSKNWFEGLEERLLLTDRVFYLLVTILFLFLLRYIITSVNKKRFMRQVKVSAFSVSIFIKKDTIKDGYLKQSIIKSMILYFIGLICAFIIINYSFMIIVVFIIGVLIVTFMNRTYMFPYGSSFYIEE